MMKKRLLLAIPAVVLLIWWYAAGDAGQPQQGTEPELVTPDKPVPVVLPWLSTGAPQSVGSDAVPATELINIGEPLDPETYVGQGAKELINIGDDIDPEADPNLYSTPSEVVNIGEYIDPEGDPNLGRQSSEYINIGEDIDADEYFYGSTKGADKLINIGEPLDPDDIEKQ